MPTIVTARNFRGAEAPTPFQSPGSGDPEASLKLPSIIPNLAPACTIAAAGKFPYNRERKFFGGWQRSKKQWQSR